MVHTYLNLQQYHCAITKAYEVVSTLAMLINIESTLRGVSLVERIRNNVIRMRPTKGGRGGRYRVNQVILTPSPFPRLPLPH